jgi:hypothetical protein
VQQTRPTTVTGYRRTRQRPAGHRALSAWSNFTFTAQTGHPYEVDLLVAAPSGLYLIEIKSLNGRLMSSGSNWILTGPSSTRTFDNPLDLADAKAKRGASRAAAQASRRTGETISSAATGV